MGTPSSVVASSIIARIAYSSFWETFSTAEPPGASVGGARDAVNDQRSRLLLFMLVMVPVLVVLDHDLPDGRRLRPGDRGDRVRAGVLAHPAVGARLALQAVVLVPAAAIASGRACDRLRARNFSFARARYRLSVPCEVKLGRNFVIDHFGGIVVSGYAVFGDVMWAVRLPALVLGGEGKGIHEMVRKRCDRIVRIPMSGKISSLNVSVAAGVALFEAARQRRLKTR